MSVAEQEFAFDPLSWIDPTGRIFWRDGDLYRGIRQTREQLYRGLFQTGLIERLTGEGLLIDTAITSRSSDEFPLILQHRVLPVVSYPSEWCGSQLKAAALMVLDLELALRAENLTLDDVNPWNVLFDGPRPLFVDFAAIAPLPENGRWPAMRLFREFFLNPLALFERGLERLARRMMFDPWTGVTDYDMERIRTFAGEPLTGRQFAYRALKRVARAPIPPALRPAIKHGARAVLDIARPKAPPVSGRDGVLSEIRVLRTRVAAMDVAGPPSPWRKYYDDNFPPFEPSEIWTAKHHAISGIIDRLAPASLLDCGANRGWYSQLAGQRGIRAIAADADEGALNALYQDTVASGAGHVHTAFLDARFPEPAAGPAYQLFKPASERFRSEMVLSLAVIHHLVFSGHLSFEQIVRNFRAFCGKWLVIEFVGPADPAVTAYANAAERPWYNEAQFVRALQEEFEIVERVASDSAGLHFKDAGPDERTIFICKAKA